MAPSAQRDTHRMHADLHPLADCYSMLLESTSSWHAANYSHLLPKALSNYQNMRNLIDCRQSTAIAFPNPHQ